MISELKTIDLSVNNQIALLTINNPKTLNALNTSVLKELGLVADKLACDKTVRVVIITGIEKSFVAGADISEMSTYGEEEAHAFAQLGSRVFRKIELLPQPVIAAVNGYALGGGCELAMACDIRIASEKAKFGQPEVGLGITPGFSGTQRLPRLVGFGKAKELIFTGKVIPAGEALEIGLINAVVAPERLLEEAQNMAMQIAGQAPIAVKWAKKAIMDGWDLSIDEGIAMEENLFADCFNSEDQKNGMAAFLRKEKMVFEGK